MEEKNARIPGKNEKQRRQAGIEASPSARAQGAKCVIAYRVENGRYLPTRGAGVVYLNITNRCNNDCAFCLRNLKTQGLWLEKEPSVMEIKSAIDNLNGVDEIVICGYGEPTCRQSELIQTLQYIKQNLKVKTRLNTNGLGNLENGREISCEFAGLLDEVSISLNAASAEKYLQVTRSKFGLSAYGAMLEFARQMKSVCRVTLTCVDKTLSESEIAKCREICLERGFNFRLRRFES